MTRIKLETIVFSGLIAATTFCSQVHADGRELLKQCAAATYLFDSSKLTDEYDIGMCMGLTEGVRDTILALASITKKEVICFPKNGISTQDGIRVVTDFLKRNPEALNFENDSILILKAFSLSYPCN